MFIEKIPNNQIIVLIGNSIIIIVPVVLAGSGTGIGLQTLKVVRLLELL